MRPVHLLLATAAATLAGLALAAGTASADYGQGAGYQIELSGNIPGNQGGGIWLWIELTPSAPNATSGTGDYSGSDCGRGAGEHARADSGQVTWTDNGDGTLTISGVVLNGLGGLPEPIIVPDSYGHETADFATVFPAVASLLGIPSGAGFAQVQVAP
ncbi:MAG TPA: hypothetical protein VFA44_12610 [Gaiellaceae bacterium]|nr:hypothetical protein [Gaiellaceae bacterium]